jgi:hypothetical protein
LQRQAQADDARKECKQTQDVQLLQLLFQRSVGAGTVWNLEQEEDQHHGHTSQRKVEPKAPSPGNICGESASDQWAGH